MLDYESGSQVIQHIKQASYRCSLPGLAGFASHSIAGDLTTECILYDSKKSDK